MHPHESGTTVGFGKESDATSGELTDILFRLHPQPMWICDQETLAIREVNESAVEYYGYSREEFLRLTLLDLAVVEQEEDNGTLTRFSSTVRGHTWRSHHRRKDGMTITVEMAARPFCFAGRPALLVMAHDISDRVRVEKALRRNEAWYRQIVEAAQEGIWLIDAEARTWYVNERMAEMLGYSRQEMLGRPLYDFLDEAAQAHARRNVERHFEGVTKHGDFRFRRRDGSALWAIVSVKPLYNDAGRYIGALGMIVDVTERRQLERQLQQAQKMEAIGRLAGGVAHDFNNLITVITGYSELVLRSMEEDNPLRRYIEEMKRAGERAALLTRQLLTFSRKQPVEMRLLDLNAVIAETEKMLRRLIGEDIELITLLRPGIGCVRADPGQLQQVLMNLVINARDAMPQGGRVTIQTDWVELDATYAACHVNVQPGPYVVLSVSDTGCGMDAETMSHIFEPFFTTKGPDKGTGLGLATVYGIVMQSGGHIDVTSEVGMGTTFKIYLPRIVSSLESEETTGGPSRRAPGGAETILVAEDEPLVRELIREVLERKGYTILEASDGREALDMARRHPGPIHLLLTDVVMPQMSGPELVKQLCCERPETKVLFMSGYSSRAGGLLNLLESSAVFLAKPFTPEALSNRVRQLLDGSVDP